MLNDFAINPNDNNQPVIQSNPESCYRKISKHTTFVFTFFTLFMIIIYLSTIIFNLKLFNFTLCIWPVFTKHQYYRLLTHNFFHLNFVHIASNLLFFYIVGINLEKKLGTAFMLTIIVQSSFVISLAYLLQIFLLNYIIVDLMKFTEYNYDFYCSAGFSAILFTLLHIKCNFQKLVDSYVMLFGIIPIKSRYVPYAYLMLIQIMIPNTSYVGHFAGIITGFVIKSFLVYFTFPRMEWINAFENNYKRIIGFMKNNLGYVDIEAINETDLEDLNEFDKGIKDFICVRLICNVFRRRNNGSQIIQINEINSINL